MRRLPSLLPALAGVAFALVATPLTGQMAPDSPRMAGPTTPAGLGVHWLRGGALPGDGDGVLVTWTPPGFPPEVRVRGGGGRGAGGEAAGFAGVDVVLGIARPASNMDLAWTAGFGASKGDWMLMSMPVGLTAGASWQSGSVWFAPYVTAGVALDLRWGEGAPDEEFEAGATVEAGLDMSLDRERRFILRAATALGDRQAIAVGVMVRTGPL